MKRILPASLLAVCAIAAAQGPAPKPSDEMKKFADYCGEWVGKAKNYMEPGKPPIEADITVSATMAMGGMYHRIKYDTEIPGMGKLDGIVLIGWDEARKAYRGHNFNNFIPTPVAETLKWEGGALVGKSEPLEAFGGLVEHTRIWMKGKDEMFLKMEGEVGGQRFVMQEIELRRKK